VAVDAHEAGLHPGTAYAWTVACGTGPASEQSSFVTALWDGFHPAAAWIWAANTSASQHYAQLRHVLAGPTKQVGRGPRQAGRQQIVFDATLIPPLAHAYSSLIDLQ